MGIKKKKEKKFELQVVDISLAEVIGRKIKAENTQQGLESKMSFDIFSLK